MFTRGTERHCVGHVCRVKGATVPKPLAMDAGEPNKGCVLGFTCWVIRNE